MAIEGYLQVFYFSAYEVGGRWVCRINPLPERLQIEHRRWAAEATGP
jgi:hypothetical protein